MRAASALALLVGGAVAAYTPSARAASYSLFYTDAGYCDIHFCPGDILHLWLVRADFDASGRALGAPVNVTNPFLGFGYLSLHPTEPKMLFATQDPTNENVNTWVVDLTTGNTSIILNDLSALIAPCAPVCNQASTFHASWSPDGSKILFAYRPWDQYGNGIGSQAIGIANADGSGAVPVTYTRNGTDDGALVSDMCPVALTPNGSRMFFTHSPDEGEATFASFVDASAPGATPPTVLAQLPQVAVASGCSNLLPTAAGDTVLYLACFGEGCESPGPAAAADAVAAGAAVGAPRRLRAPATAAAPSAARPHKSTLAHRWGGPVRTAAARRPAVAAAAARTVAGGAAAVAHPAATALPLFGYVNVSLPAGGNVSAATANLMFPVALVNSPSYLDTYSVTQCDAIHRAPPGAPLSCQGADTTHNSFQRLFVDRATGNSTTPDYDGFVACMTPRCSQMSV